MKRFVLAAVLLAATAATAVADLETGFASFERGDFSAAQQELQPLAEQGDPRAQYMLGIIYLNGYLDSPTPQTAVEWLHKSAEQGYGRAQSELARMYRSGDGVPQDYREMARWYEAAAEQGDVGAQLLLADTYAYGYGVEMDFVQAYKWYEIAIQYWGPLAVRARDLLGDKMSAEDIATAVTLAGKWLQNRPAQ